jgi:GAF domain-containing protein
MPAPSRQMVEAMACLGGRAEPSLLQAATAAPASVVDQALAPALDEGLLVAEPGAHEAVRFRHDRIREVILRGIDPERRRTLHLAMARRLAAVPELYPVAAEQYLPVVDTVDDAAERQAVVGLLRRAADQAALIGDHALVNALLAAALALIDPGETATRVEVHTGRHAALFSMGRLDEADEEYRTIEALCPTAVQRVGATAVQVRSLTLRNRLAEATGLGIGSLRECGITVPVADRLAAGLDRQFDYLYRWLDHTDAADDLARPDITDPTLLAATRLINAVLPAVYFVADHATLAWLSLEALRIWLEHGPARTLLGPASHTGIAAVALRGDYAAGYRALRRILALGEARGYEPDTSQVRYQFADLSWCFEPVENCVHAVQQARAGLIAGGDLANASYSTYHPTVSGLLDCAPSLDVCVAEVEAGLAFVRRTGNEKTGQWLDSFRWLAGALRGESAAAAGEAVPTDTYAGNPFGLLHAHITRAMAAAIFGDPAGLTQHTAPAMPLLPAALGTYPTALTHLLRGLALAGQARASEGDERGGLLAELEEVTRWLAARAADAPDNFLHLLRLLEAERAWAVGDFRGAVLAFDAARREAAQRRRPWHRALIIERAARFYLAHGVEHAGYDLLAQARHEYATWGASAKVAQLDWAYPALRPQPDAIAADSGDQPADLPPRHSTVTTGTIDLLGILSGSQALSSETSIEGLHSRVVEVLGAMTGATGVQLALWSEDRQDWLLPAPGSNRGAVLVGGTGHEHAVPMSVLRYAQRMREPLVVGDATGDDRFARDPYFADVDCCSLLAVPILSRGTLRAVLLLENRLIRGAFTAERLDGVQLIAGQLAVSLDNAQVYAEFRRIADEQAALRRVETLVARAAPPEEVFAAVAQEVAQVLDAEHTIMSRYDPDGAVTVVGAWTRRGAATPIPVGLRLERGGRNLHTMVFQTRRPARIDDYADATGPAADAARKFGVRSSVGVPISVAGRLWGVMSVGSIQEGPLPADTEERLVGFTELAATAIANAQARMEVRGYADEQAALRRVATLIARAAPPEEVFAAVTAEVGRVLAADITVMDRYDPDGTETTVGVWSSTGAPPVPVGTRESLGGRNVTTMVFQTGRPARIDDYADATGPIGDVAGEVSIRAAVGVPVSVEGRLWGVMLVATTRDEPLPAETETRLTGFTELVATAIANAEARAALTTSRARIVATADQTRRRIERDLHDGAQQQLVSLALRLRATRAAVPPALGADLEQIEAGLTDALDELREIARGIHPAILAKGGLGPALHALARRSPTPVHLDVRAEGRLPEPVEVSAYYVVAEALTNAAKHAHASGVSVDVEVAGDVLRVAVRDDGTGGADFTRGTGLAGLKDRVEALGGRILLDSPRGAGTSLRVELPLTAANGGVTSREPQARDSQARFMIQKP